MPENELDQSAPRRLLGLSADEVLSTTRAVRKRLDLTRPVPRELVAECVKLAVQAPSGRNTQRWDFIVVEDEAKKRAVADIWRHGLMMPVAGEADTPKSVRIDFASDQWVRIVGSLRYLVDHLHEVPLILVPCLRVDTRQEFATVRGMAGSWGSVIPAVWSFMLAARERGLGTAWTTCHLTYEQEMADVLEIPWANVVQVALSPIAYTIGTDFKPGPRADHDAFLHWNRW